jgi:multiple sugar transport system substrate-binding protein
MKKRISRRDFMKVAGITGGAVILSACAPSATTQAPQTAAEGAEEPTAAPQSSETVEITFTGWGGTEEDQGVKDAAAYYEENNPGYKINWIQIPDNYAEKIMAMVAAGTPPDTAFVDNTNFQQYSKSGMLMDITDALKSDPVLGAADYFIQPQEEQRCTRDGKWYGIGSCWVAPHLYYNKDIFDKEGIEPPSNDPEKAWDWDKFLEISNQLTIDANGKHPNDSGFDKDNMERWAIQWPTNGATYLHSSVAINGSKWVNMDTGLLEIDQPAAIEAIQRVADMMLVQNIAPRSANMEALGLTNTQMLENGKLAMAMDGSWALSWITKINATLGTAVLPKMSTVATDMQAHIHCPFAKSKYPDAAWKWIRFLGTEYYQLIFLKIGLWLPSQTALMAADGMEKWYTERKGPGDGIHPAGYDLIVKDYVPKYGQVLYMPPGYSEASDIITPALDAVWIGDKTAEEALTEAVPEANLKLQEAAK